MSNAGWTECDRIKLGDNVFFVALCKCDELGNYQYVSMIEHGGGLHIPTRSDAVVMSIMLKRHFSCE